MGGFCDLTNGFGTGCRRCAKVDMSVYKLPAADTNGSRQAKADLSGHKLPQSAGKGGYI